MGYIWTLENKFRAWLKVELAVCEAWYQLGYIPQEEIETIRTKADFDLDKILALEEKSKHDVIAFLSAVEEKVGSASRFIHLGCTSSDIVDTANGVLLAQAGEIIFQDLARILSILKEMALRYKSCLTMGRTHGVHAEPTSFGLKLAGFYAEFSRHLKRWEQALEEVKVGKISGAVGTYAHLSPQLEEIACNILGLSPDPIATQVVARDRYANYFSALAQVAGSLERLAVELRHLQRTEVLEAEEGFSKGQKGSSAMPHKKNPISAENICGLARVVRSNSLASLENVALWHERDISHSSVERVIMPDSTILIDYMLDRMSNILHNLKVNPQNMQHNLYLSHGLFFSQRILNELINQGLKRQKAYEIVQTVAMEAWEKGDSFEGLVRKNQEINNYLSQDKLDALFDPKYYLQHEDLILKRVLGE